MHYKPPLWHYVLFIFFLFITLQELCLKQIIKSPAIVRKLNTDSSRILRPKAFEKWGRSIVEFPCYFTREAEKDPLRGIFYIKVPKTASSLLAQVTERLAYRESKRKIRRESIIDTKYFNTSTHCKINKVMEHQLASDLGIKYRDKMKSFTWSMIRHPKERTISHFGMFVERYNRKSVEVGVEMAKIMSNGVTDYSDESFFRVLPKLPVNIQLRFLALDKYPDDRLLTDEEISSLILDIIHGYNFIGVYERFLESLVVFSMIADVEISDVYFPQIPNPCNSKTVTNWLTPAMQKHFLSSEWKERENADLILYDIMNKSLDLTIESLGYENVQKNLVRFMKLLNVGSMLRRDGCGIPNLNSNKFADIDEMPWFDRLSDTEKMLVRSWDNEKIDSEVVLQ